jgi:hypothetical protein
VRTDGEMDRAPNLYPRLGVGNLRLSDPSDLPGHWSSIDHRAARRRIRFGVVFTSVLARLFHNAADRHFVRGLQGFFPDFSAGPKQRLARSHVEKLAAETQGHLLSPGRLTPRWPAAKATRHRSLESPLLVALPSIGAVQDRRAPGGSVEPCVSALTIERKGACFQRFRQRLTAARGEELVCAVARLG